MISIDDATRQRFWKNVDVRDSDSCWEWTGGTGKNGNCITGKWNPYKSGLSCHVHRAAWQFTNGEVPEGKRIRHICDSLLCCNPAHLVVASDLEERFWSKVDKTPGLGVGDCWLWTARISVGGYGQFRADPKKAHVPAHRVAYELTRGEIAPDHVICHRCDVRACVNPKHLFSGTTRDNIHDMIKKGRSNFLTPPRLIGMEHPNAVLTDDIVSEIRKMLSEGATYQQVMDKYGISSGTVYNIKKRKSWGHVK